jgi:hypothetical protein
VRNSLEIAGFHGWAFSDQDIDPVTSIPSKTTYCVGLAALLSLTAPAVAHSFGAPAGRSGAPGETTCGQCHTSYPLNTGSASFQVLLPSHWQPGEQVPVTVGFFNSRTTTHGFQITARTPAGTTAGFFQPVDGNTQTLTPGSWQTHTSVGITRSWWTFLWNPPDAAHASVTFYVAGNEASGDGTNLGDFIYTISRTIPVFPLTRLGTPRVGATISLELNAPGDAGLGYVIGASLERYGLALPDGRPVPLQSDPLLVLSLLGYPGFRNFRGGLDTAGHAVATADLPNDQNLVGIAFHFAGLTLDGAAPSGVRTVTNGQAVTLEL